MTAIIIECLLALMFLVAALSKILGSKQQVEGFKTFGLPQWFRVITGLMQLIGIAALVVGIWEESWAAWAGIWFSIMMLCAVAVHLRIKDPFSKMMPAIFLLILSVSVTLLHGSELIPSN
jgi:putative oxidoreductase